MKITKTLLCRILLQLQACLSVPAAHMRIFEENALSSNHYHHHQRSVSDTYMVLMRYPESKWLALRIRYNVRSVCFQRLIRAHT